MFQPFIGLYQCTSLSQNKIPTQNAVFGSAVQNSNGEAEIQSSTVPIMPRAQPLQGKWTGKDDQLGVWPGLP